MTDTTDLKAEYERLKVIIGDANPDEIIELVFFHFYGIFIVLMISWNFRREAAKLISNQDGLPEFEEAPAYQPPQQPAQKSSQSNWHKA